MPVPTKEARAVLFRRPWWMWSGHIETIVSLFAQDKINYHNRVVQMPDDEILLSYLQGRDEMPLLVLFHGLEGCAQSRVMRLLAAYFAARGWTVAVPHFRSCGHMNRLPRAYHAADGRDVRWLVTYCRAQFARPQTFAAGVSLGGNALIHSLVDDGESLLSAAATISAPLNLTAAAHHLNRGIARYVYGRHFVKLLRAKVQRKAARYPFICHMKNLNRVRTLGEFDELYTAPVHGFANAEDYWRRGSVMAILPSLKTPLLCINAKNDPLVPFRSLPTTAAPAVEFCRPRHGGHGGFWGSPPDWLAATVEDFFARHGE